MDPYALLLLLLTWTDTIGEDIWRWFLQNFNIVASVNQKIASIGAEQVLLATQQQAMQDNKDREQP